jgi:23S rRNA-/tRNA-specific pseudouridylate synthase
VHRLDKDTSGVLMLAKTGPMLQAMKDLFSKKEVQKFYLALVDGSFSKKTGVIDNFLGKEGVIMDRPYTAVSSPTRGSAPSQPGRALKKGFDAPLFSLSPRQAGPTSCGCI